MNNTSEVVIDLSDSRTRFETGGSKFVIFKKEPNKPEWYFSEFDESEDGDVVAIGKIKEFPTLQEAFHFAGRLGLKFF